ncbi:hypothetical protein [Micromonospora sp. NPDC093244]|uniref:hypothetical protein n=1 Tax=Micromonospora sp. NPDC093244 TaxID=3155071 RepID=UPI00342F4FF8
MRGIEVHRSKNVVWFTGPQLAALIELAAPLATWWQDAVAAVDHQVDFRFVALAESTSLLTAGPMSLPNLGAT